MLDLRNENVGSFLLSYSAPLLGTSKKDKEFEKERNTCFNYET